MKTDFMEILEFATRKHKVHIITNGTTLSDKVVEDLMRLRLKSVWGSGLFYMGVSIEGGEARIIQVVGEVVTKKGKSNLRNYASGALNLKSLDEFKTRDLYFVAYGVYGLSGIKTYAEAMTFLSKNGF